jgi:hypothetical protein
MRHATLMRYWSPKGMTWQMGCLIVLVLTLAKAVACIGV